MKYEVDGWNNFCRVFELPQEYPVGYCFGGGYPVNFQMVDWFNPVSDVTRPAVSKKIWQKNVGEIEVTEVTHKELCAILIPFLLEKQYVKQGRKYLVVCDFGATFIIERNPV